MGKLRLVAKSAEGFNLIKLKTVRYPLMLIPCRKGSWLHVGSSPTRTTLVIGSSPGGSTVHRQASIPPAFLRWEVLHLIYFINSCPDY